MSCVCSQHLHCVWQTVKDLGFKFTTALCCIRDCGGLQVKLKKLKYVFWEQLFNIAQPVTFWWLVPLKSKSYFPKVLQQSWNDDENETQTFSFLILGADTRLWFNLWVNVKYTCFWTLCVLALQNSTVQCMVSLSIGTTLKDKLLPPLLAELDLCQGLGSIPLKQEEAVCCWGPDVCVQRPDK